MSHTVITLWGDEHEQEDGMTEPMTQPVPRRPGWVLIATTSGLGSFSGSFAMGGQYPSRA